MSSTAVVQLMHTATRLHQAGHLDQAERLYRQAMSLEPDHADPVHLLGVIACQRQQLDLGLKLISHAISLSPNTAAYHNSMGNALRGSARPTDAVAAYRRACELDRGNLQALNNLAVLLDDLDQQAESLSCFDRLIGARNDIPEFHINRGSAQLNANQLQAAIASFRQAIALRPDFAAAHAKLSAALLKSGQFTEGWEEAEWRFRVGMITAATDPAPVWDGSPLAGRTLLIHSEQGLGDNLQFIRFARLIDKTGGRVIVRCIPSLQKLLSAAEGIDAVASTDQPIPLYDLQISMLSIPRVFRTTPETIPSRMPYLHADSAKVTDWAQRFFDSRRAGDRTANDKTLPIDPRPLGQGYPTTPVRVGIAWAGNPSHANDHRRSCPPEYFSQLADLPGIEWHRLQIPTHLPPPPNLPLIDHTNLLMDLSDTAALIANLDLVISVDTAIVHLAGALAKPCWILLPYCAEWRWLETGGDCPWYPTARLFRQSTPGDWRGVMQSLRSAFEESRDRRVMSD